MYKFWTESIKNILKSSDSTIVIIGSEKEDKLRKNEIKVHETPEGSKREPTITNDYFHYSDDYYDQFCKPSLYFTPSVQKYTHTHTLTFHKNT